MVLVVVLVEVDGRMPAVEWVMVVVDNKMAVVKGSETLLQEQQKTMKWWMRH